MLVATSVIEVGIDVAERHGDADRGRRAVRALAAPSAARADRPRRARVALHPLRRPERAARAPRGDRRGSATASSSPRSTSNLRGEGEVLGTRQSGMPRFRAATLPDDAELLVAARARPDRDLLERYGLARRAGARAAARRRARRVRRRAGRSRSPPEASSVRIVAGELGGRRSASAPPGDRRPARPRDRVREALFSILGDDRRGRRPRPVRRDRRARRSRRSRAGPRRATLVDDATRPGRGERQAHLDVGDRGELIRVATRSGSSRRARGDSTTSSSATRPIDSRAAWPPISTTLLRARLAEGGRVIVETARSRRPLDLGLPLLDERVYGSTMIRIHGAG